MTRRLLFAYQILTGLSDASTGLLLIVAPVFTLRLMQLHAAPAALPFLSYAGVFVLSVGIACFYGAILTRRPLMADKLEVVWLLTGITRALVAAFVLVSIVSKTLEAGWITVAITDGAIALFQFYGLARGWLKRVEA
ncbi:MAG: hypothetical protein HIU91_01960 [Acidobacteria bacterium]|nr:hypothetical protein [Acidobacteriota bacterium]